MLRILSAQWGGRLSSERPNRMVAITANGRGSGNLTTLPIQQSLSISGPALGTGANPDELRVVVEGEDERCPPCAVKGAKSAFFAGAAMPSVGVAQVLLKEPPPSDQIHGAPLTLSLVTVEKCALPHLDGRLPLTSTYQRAIRPATGAASPWGGGIDTDALA